MTTLTIGGVPEHFNLPWHLAIEEGKFTNEGIDLKWKEFPDGTGAMNKALRD
ncbi:MAG: ABC transporter substrate-binding protein, partial [Aureibaculum sp.]